MLAACRIHRGPWQLRRQNVSGTAMTVSQFLQAYVPGKVDRPCDVARRLVAGPQAPLSMVLIEEVETHVQPLTLDGSALLTSRAVQADQSGVLTQRPDNYWFLGCGSLSLGAPSDRS